MEYFRLTIAFIFCILIQGSFQEENEQRDGKGTSRAQYLCSKTMFVNAKDIYFER